VLAPRNVPVEAYVALVVTVTLGSLGKTPNRRARMRARYWRGRLWAARLGLLALALNALVPVHLAFDLAEAFEPEHQRGVHAGVGGAERRLLASFSGHRETDGTSDEHGKHHACSVCSALGALAGFAPPAPTALLALFPVGLPTTHFVVWVERVSTPTAYRSRAPPVA
jgi:hypothetical protein